ncbi:MAG: serine/threonine-protein kinase, partial [Myxococcota bacterium]
MTTPPDSLIGRTLAGRYRVQQRLDQGGMGEIYVATQVPLGRQVVLKLLRSELANDEIALKRFEKEARAASALTHPHIVTIYDFGQAEGNQLYLAMEFLRGRSLRRVLEEDGPLSWTRSLHVVRGMLRGLAEAHSRGIIHRDLKPDNVMVVPAGDDDDFVKLLDFGLARTMELDAANAARLTQRNSVPGTPAYMPPERISGANDDGKSDLYSLGAMWFELLTGQIPFPGPTPVQILVRHLQDPPPKVHAYPLRDPTPPWADEVIGRLMAKSPAERPQSAAELLRWLADLERPNGRTESPRAASPEKARSGPEAAARPQPHTATETSFEVLSEESLGRDAFVAEVTIEEPIALTRLKSDPSVPPHAPPPTEEDVVVLLTQKKGAKPPEAPPSREELALAGATDVTAVVTAATQGLRRHFDRIALVDMRGNPPRLLGSMGFRQPERLCREVVSPSALRGVLSSRGVHYGSPPTTAVWTELFH